MRQPSAIEMQGIKAIIKEWSGLDINLVNGGPSVSDPMGIHAGYISFRDSRGTGYYLAFDEEGKINKALGHSDAG